MERLMMITDIMERYKCNEKTARNYMREMGAIKTKPMMVRETAVEAWERRREEESLKKCRRESRKPENVFNLAGRLPKPKPGQIISRQRPKRKEA